MTVQERIHRERARLTRLSTLAVVAFALAVAGVLLAVGALVLGGARWIELPSTLPFVVWGIALTSAGLVAHAVSRRLRREASLPAMAREIERDRSLRRGSLLGVLELGDSSPLARAAERRLAGTLGAGGEPLAPTLRKRAATRGVTGFAALGAGAILLAGLGGRNPDGIRALINPLEAAKGTLLPAIELVDAPHTVLRGEPLSITVSAPGRRKLTVAYRTTGASWVDRTLRVNEDGVAHIRFESVDADLLVTAGDGRSTSDTAHVSVTERPFLGDMVIQAEYPAYLHRQAETLPSGELLRVPRGTVLRASATASTLLSSAGLTNEEGDTLRVQTEGRRASARITASRSGRWTWNASAPAGSLLDLPPAIELDVVPDNPPVVEIVAPARDTFVFPSDTVALRIGATDDHGIGTVVLRTWRQRRNVGAGSTSGQELSVGGLTDWMGDAVLPLEGHDLQPGDELHVVAVAVDASPWRQAGESRELILRVPLPDEQRAAVREAADAAAQRASELASAQRSLEQRTAAAARTRDHTQSAAQQDPNSSPAGERNMSFDGAERARQLSAEQRELQRRAREAADAAEQLERQLRDAGALDDELQQQLREARRLMEEALSPDLQQQLSELDQAAQGLNEQRTREALGDLAERQRQIREQLERSAEMLRRAAIEGAMETMRDEAQELANEQRELAEALSQRDAGESRPRAEEVARRTERLAEDVRKLEERLREQAAEQGAAGVAEARPHADASREAMERAAGQPEAKQESGQAQEAGRQDQQSQQQSAAEQNQRSQQQAAAEQNQRSQQSAVARQGERTPEQTAAGVQGERRQQQAQAGETRTQQQTGEQQRAGRNTQAGAETGARQSREQAAQQGEQGTGGERGSNAGESASAREAAEQMQAAAERLGGARQAQVDAWKQELSSELDQTISEMMQLAREQQAVEQSAAGGQASSSEIRSAQSAIQQGVERAGERISQASQASSHLSQGSQRAISEARQQVARAAEAAAGNAAGTPPAGAQQQMASSMNDASQALTQAAASLVRDRERINSASSASGFSEMIEQLRELAQRQGALNSQTGGLLPGAGRQAGQGARDAARRLSQQQRELARDLEDVGDRDASGRTDEMAREARQLADALEMGALDPSVAERQQRLFRRMLDAGRTLEREEREDTGQREGETATTSATFRAADGSATGQSAREFRVPDWSELRGLSAEERRLVLEYFRRLNAERKP